jgi:hypothetical protein
MIELEQLQEMFDGIAAGPRWDMQRPMRWGYFFTDASVERLEVALERLVASGYRPAGLYPAKVDAHETPYFWLHVECDEVHSPETLHARNLAFYALAGELGLKSYDGMDVGPVPA